MFPGTVTRSSVGYLEMSGCKECEGHHEPHDAWPRLLERSSASFDRKPGAQTSRAGTGAAGQQARRGHRIKGQERGGSRGSGR